MARPSMTSPNVGTLVVEGKARKVLAIWEDGRFVLRLLNHGRPGRGLSYSKTIRALKKKVRGFRLVQN